MEERRPVMKRTWMLFLGIAATSFAQGPTETAAAILEHANQAQKAVAAKNQSAALDHIQQAKSLAQQILQARSSDSGPVLVEIKLQVEAPQQVTASMLDVKSAARRLDQAQDAVKRGDWQAADAALSAVPHDVNPMNVRDD